MTKLMEWVSVLVVFSSFYLSIVTGQIKSELLDHWMFQILIFPFLAVLLFGIYSVVTIFYRVFTLKDCPEAAEEIQKQIAEAKADLKAKGLKF